MRFRFMSLAFGLWSTMSCAQVPTSFKFSFNALKSGEDYEAVSAVDMYTKEKGWGFDFNTSNRAEDRPYYFSVAVPEGNYKVTVTLGNKKRAAVTTVKAESRRLMLEAVTTKAGESVRKTFMVNVKDRSINNGEVVALKTRELTKLDWDEKLTLEFAGRPALQAIELSRVEDQVTVYLAGNSTVVNQEDEPWASWGQMIPRFFKPGVCFANHAESGLTLGSFIGSKRLIKILSIIKPGDYLFIEFGHNDQKDRGPEAGAYKSYSKHLRTFITAIREKGAIPVILTSTSRRSFQNGKIVNSLGDFPDAARKVASSENVALIDLNVLTTTFYNALGESGSKKAFVHYPANSYPGQVQPLADNTHFNTYGAYQISKCVIEGIKSAKLGLADYLIDRTTTFDPANPDAVSSWHWPESPGSNVLKPDGN